MLMFCLLELQPKLRAGRGRVRAPRVLVHLMSEHLLPKSRRTHDRQGSSCAAITLS